MVYPQVPVKPIPTSLIGSGFVREFALHRHGKKYIQETSYSYVLIHQCPIVLALAAPIAADLFVVWLIPGLFGVAPIHIFIGGSIFGLILPFVIWEIVWHWRAEKRVIVDPLGGTVTIRRVQAEATAHSLVEQIRKFHRTGRPIKPSDQIPKPQTDLVIGWSDIVGIQISGAAKTKSYQANLVYKKPDGEFGRTCLASHQKKPQVLSLAGEYFDEFQFKTIDHSDRMPLRSPNTKQGRRIRDR
jgi:hypothetical protein